MISLLQWRPPVAHAVRHGDKLRAAAASASALPSPINVDYLATEFGGRGVSFESIGEDCAVKLEVENGSAAHLLLPAGLLTSYKPLMWHGSTVELLHTAVYEGSGDAGGEPVIQGGVSMEFQCAAADGGWAWSPRRWSIRDVTGEAENHIQVELASFASPEKMVEARCTVTLRSDLLSSEFTIRNGGASPLRLSGSVITHLTVSTPDAVYATGLHGSSYHGRRPKQSQFSIIPPDFKKPYDSEGEEDSNITHMTSEMCRVYAYTPTEFMVIDKGRRNSVSIGTSGFQEMYVLSPGSKHEWYGKYAYICIGPEMPTPVVLGPQCTWQGGQYLLNPNV